MKPFLIVNSVVFITEALIRLIYFCSIVTIWIIGDSYVLHGVGDLQGPRGATSACLTSTYVVWLGEYGEKAFSSSPPTPCEEEQHHVLLIHCGRNVKLVKWMTCTS